MSASRRDTLLILLALALAVLWVFQPSFSAGLVNWDDEPGIARNHAFRGLGPEQLHWMFTTHTLGHFQPLAWLSLACDHALYGLSRGLDAPELGLWHRTSVLLHLLTALLVFGLGRDVLARALPRASERTLLWAAGLSAALFAVHPLRAESVAWLTERRDVLSGLFFVGALWAAWRAQARRSASAELDLRADWMALACAALAATCALAALDLQAEPGLALARGGAALLVVAVLALAASTALATRVAGLDSRSRALFALAVGLSLLSLFTKAWGMVLPAVLLVCDVAPLGRLGPAPRARRALALLTEKAPFIALAVVFGRLAAWAQGSEQGTMAGLETHSLVERGLQAGYGLVWYPLATAWPSGLVAFVELPADVRAADPRFALPLVTLALVGAALFALRRRAPAVPAALAAYAVIVSPVLGLAQSGAQLVADRYSYLSSLPLGLLAAGLLAALAARPRARTAVLLGSLVWIALLSAAGRRQVRVWHDSRSLWSHALQVDATDSYAAVKLAQALLLESRPESAAADLARARTLLAEAPRSSDPIWHATVSQSLLAQARAEPARRAAHVAAAVEAAQRAVELQGERADPEMRLNLATALIESGRFGEAVPQLEAFTRERPAEAVGWTNLGVALAASGRAQLALGPLERALALEPDYAKAWQFLAQAREQVGDRGGALEAWRRVLGLWPDSAQARARIQALSP